MTKLLYLKHSQLHQLVDFRDQKSKHRTLLIILLELYLASKFLESIEYREDDSKDFHPNRQANSILRIIRRILSIITETFP